MEGTLDDVHDGALLRAVALSVGPVEALAGVCPVLQRLAGEGRHTRGTSALQVLPTKSATEGFMATVKESAYLQNLVGSLLTGCCT